MEVDKNKSKVNNTQKKKERTKERKKEREKVN